MQGRRRTSSSIDASCENCVLESRRRLGVISSTFISHLYYFYVLMKKRRKRRYFFLCFTWLRLSVRFIRSTSTGIFPTAVLRRHTQHSFAVCSNGNVRDVRFRRGFRSAQQRTTTDKTTTIQLSRMIEDRSVQERSFGSVTSYAAALRGIMQQSKNCAYCDIKSYMTLPKRIIERLAPCVIDVRAEE